MRDVFGPWNPRDNVSFERLAELILEVRKRVEGSTEDERSRREWLEYLLPPREQEEDVLRESGMLAPANSESQAQPQSQTTATAITPSLRRLLDETSDLIDSPTFTHVLTLCLDSAISLLIDGKVGPTAFKMGAQPSQDPRQTEMSSAAFSGPDSRIVDVTDSPDANGTPTAKLATVLATFTKQAGFMGRGGDDAIAALGAGGFGGSGGALGSSAGGATAGLAEANEYLAVIEAVRDLEAFAAVVYSSNFEFEGLNREDGDDLENEAQRGVEVEKEATRMPSSRDIENSLVEVRSEVEGKLESAWDKAQAAASSSSSSSS